MEWLFMDSTHTGQSYNNGGIKLADLLQRLTIVPPFCKQIVQRYRLVVHSGTSGFLLQNHRLLGGRIRARIAWKGPIISIQWPIQDEPTLSVKK